MDLGLSPTDSIQLYDYRVYQNPIRHKINLTSHTISFLVNGIKEVHGSEQSVIVDHNKFVLMKSGKVLMTENVSSANRQYQSMLLFFSDDPVIAFLEKHRIQPTNTRSTNAYCLFSYDAYSRQFVQGLEQLSLLNKPLQRQILHTKFEEIMLYLTQKHGVGFLFNMLSQPDDTSIRLKNVVENNRLNKLTLQELAFLCNMSISTFKRNFYNHYQQTPIKWFQEARLMHAAMLLSMQKKRPVDLYEEAGYETLSNFVQAFKKKYGVTPKQYQLQS